MTEQCTHCGLTSDVPKCEIQCLRAQREIELLRQQRDSNLAKEVEQTQRLNAEIERLLRTLEQIAHYDGSGDRMMIIAQNALDGSTVEPTVPQDIRALFNKGIGVQKGNRFSFAFETEEEANRAFHYIGELGELQTSQPPLAQRPQSIYEPCKHGVIGNGTCIDCHDEGLRAAFEQRTAPPPPDVLADALQDVVHEDTGAVRAGRSVRNEPSAPQKYQTTPGTIDGPCIHCGQPFTAHWQHQETYSYMCSGQRTKP